MAGLPPAWDTQLEPHRIIDTPPDPIKCAALVSIAISLKRIADALTDPKREAD